MRSRRRSYRAVWSEFIGFLSPHVVRPCQGSGTASVNIENNQSTFAEIKKVVGKSVDDERSRTKKDTTLIAINVLSILLTASLIKVIPADRKSSGRK